jgi:hypothetical protein
LIVGSRHDREGKRREISRLMETFAERCAMIGCTLFAAMLPARRFARLRPRIRHPAVDA